MSTEVKSHTKNFLLTRFFGGNERGTCLQITNKEMNQNAEWEHITVTREEAIHLAHDLLNFVADEQEDLE